VHKKLGLATLQRNDASFRGRCLHRKHNDVYLISKNAARLGLRSCPSAFPRPSSYTSSIYDGRFHEWLELLIGQCQSPFSVSSHIVAVPSQYLHTCCRSTVTSLCEKVAREDFERLVAIDGEVISGVPFNTFGRGFGIVPVFQLSVLLWNCRFPKERVRSLQMPGGFLRNAASGSTLASVTLGEVP
jgi:hypothetical protein